MGYSLSDRNILGILETISDINILGNSTRQKADNFWFINYSKSNSDSINVLQEKEIILSNNKVVIINYINVKTYKKLFESIIKTNKYPYSLTEIAIELGYSHWKQIEKYVNTIENEENMKVKENVKYCIKYNKTKRYTEALLKRIKEAKNKFKSRW